LVYEPPGYFGDFFNGVIPLPSNSRVWKSLVRSGNPFLPCSLFTPLLCRIWYTYFSFLVSINF
jgi:hypothetical protein